MVTSKLRLAVRGIVMQDNRLLLVNAYGPALGSDLWCAPGGGVEAHQSLPENLAREIHEETGLKVHVGELALVNEFHSPENRFHQVEMFFRCLITGGDLRGDWQDPEGIVTRRHFFSYAELRDVRLKPDSLPDVAFGATGPARYDLLERIISP